MKTIDAIKQEISGIENLSEDQIKEMKPVQWRRKQKHLELLRQMEKYLFTSPTEMFVVSEIGRIENIVSAKMLEFDPSKYEDLPKKEVSRLRKAHESLYGISKMRKQLRTLRFLLK